jgi:pyruvate/2-oxoglutarate dehydrogenase complex dihydrolipoamide acyltransferase (E2) component
MTVLLAKAVAMALAQHPVVNASCRDGKSFTYNSNINIAVAVAIDGGLITPVLQDADKVYTVLIVNLISSRRRVGSKVAIQLMNSYTAVGYLFALAKLEGSSKKGTRKTAPAK